jgi:hypothetical protein
MKKFKQALKDGLSESNYKRLIKELEAENGKG